MSEIARRWQVTPQQVFDWQAISLSTTVGFVDIIVSEASAPFFRVVVWVCWFSFRRDAWRWLYGQRFGQREGRIPAY